MRRSRIRQWRSRWRSSWRPRSPQPVMLVRQPLPPGAEEDAALMQIVSHGTLAALTGGQTAGGYLLSQGADTALEIHVENAMLAGNGGINPKLALCVEARATLLRSRDGQQLYSCPVQYRSQGRKFTEWAAHDAKLVPGGATEMLPRPGRRHGGPIGRARARPARPRTPAHVREALMHLSLRQSSAIPENLFAPRRWLRFPPRRVSKQKA